MSKLNNASKYGLFSQIWPAQKKRFPHRSKAPAVQTETLPVGALYFVVYSKTQEGRDTPFFNVVYALTEQVYRIERGIGLSSPIRQGHKIETIPSIYDMDEANCEIDVVFPAIHDPKQFPQVLVGGGPASSWKLLFGKYETWVLYQGAPIDFKSYFDPNNASEMIT